MTAKQSFKDKIILVTGGSSGIGYATVCLLAELGAKTTVIADLNEEGLLAAEAYGKKNGLHLKSMKVDVSDPIQVQEMVQSLIDEYGRLDGAVNNAGIEGDMMPTHECSEDNWDRVLNINLKGTWLCMKYEISHMLAAGQGSIVNVSSTAGIGGLPRWPAYSAAKHGIVGLTKTAALEYAKTGLRINAVCPGAIETNMTKRIITHEPAMKEMYLQLEPVGRMGKPEEVAEGIVWLLSGASSFVTGQCLHIDGGFLAF